MKGNEPMTNAERQKRHRDARNAEGWKLVQVYLEPRSTAIVQRLINTGLTQAQAINRCIQSFSSGPKS